MHFTLWLFSLSSLFFIPNGKPWVTEHTIFDVQIIICSKEGHLQLWNISTKEKKYEFKGWNSSIHCCVSSPALDVIAVGCSDGTVHVHNIRYDDELFSFKHSGRGAVTALAFRTGTSWLISFLNI